MKKFILYLILLFLLIAAACTKEIPKSKQEISPTHPEEQQQDEKFGLPESTRKEIYETLKEVKHNAEIVAKKRFPIRGSMVLTSEHPIVKNREKVVQAHLAKAKNLIAMTYNLAVEQVEEIAREGKEKLWMPGIRLDGDWQKVDPGWRIPPAGPISLSLPQSKLTQLIIRKKPSHFDFCNWISSKRQMRYGDPIIGSCFLWCYDEVTNLLRYSDDNDGSSQTNRRIAFG